MKPSFLTKLRRNGPDGPPAYKLLTTEVIGPLDDQLTVTKWAALPQTSSRRFQIHDAVGELLFDTDDCHDGGNALHKTMTWLGERQKQYDAKAAATVAELQQQFAADDMMTPRDETWRAEDYLPDLPRD